VYEIQWSACALEVFLLCVEVALYCTLDNPNISVGEAICPFELETNGNRQGT
jgi:hypothetical protein